ncbi:hypothetical protein DFH09DRAFT_984336, partial [Mycena vulgaris]
MLLLFFIAHLLSINSTAAREHFLDPRASVNSCDDINNCRRMFDIVWGCLTTVFACTWVSVHPNVPPPDQSWLARLWRRLRMMLVAVIAPELMVGFAARQLYAAWTFSKKFNVTLAHGFFFSMGGFVSRSGNPITTLDQLDDPVLGEQYEKAICNVKVGYIKGRGKGDALSKGVALTQGLWFITQCIARVHQRLPVTELEVATLAFASVNIFIWAIWWKKPLDVEQPIRIGPVEDAPERLPKTPRLDWRERFSGVMIGDYAEYNPLVSNWVPSFWSMEEGNDSTMPAFLIELFVGTIFGVIHCTAWAADFPSAPEMWMWRVGALVVTAIPGVGLLIFGTLQVFTPEYDPTYTEVIIFAAVVAMYPFARLFLIVLPFTTLRALPPGAFTDVNWSIYIPHL